MKKFIILFIFIGITLVNLLIFLLIRGVNSTADLTFDQKALDFSREYDVRIDIDFLKENLNPAYE